MNWLQRNNYIIILLAMFLIIVLFILITDNGKITYEQIEIERGDTLWALAEQYRGNLSYGDWIAKVKEENNLHNENIIAGQQLSIPISQDALNIAQDEMDSVRVVIQTDEEKQ